jgi:hypothetical protein
MMLAMGVVSLMSVGLTKTEVYASIAALRVGEGAFGMRIYGNARSGASHRENRLSNRHAFILQIRNLLFSAGAVAEIPPRRSERIIFPLAGSPLKF